LGTMTPRIKPRSLYAALAVVASIGRAETPILIPDFDIQATCREYLRRTGILDAEAWLPSCLQGQRQNREFALPIWEVAPDIARKSCSSKVKTYAELSECLMKELPESERIRIIKNMWEKGSKQYKPAADPP
jgi:predicted nucleic acid-binding protein